MDIAPEELEICLNVLQRISEDPAMMDHHERFKALVAKIHREGKKSARRAARERLCTADQDLRAMTRMAQAQRDERPAMPIGVEPSGNVIGTLNRSRLCYICKQPYITLHAFYHLLCPDCAELNYARRQQRVDLTGRTALVTGGRIKIGYQTALRMLRDGAHVIVTTRFPCDCARRFGAEADRSVWQDRLRIYGLELRDLCAVEGFLQHLVETEPALDILINNAAQTIKRPLAFYRHLLEQEAREAPSAEIQKLIPYGVSRTPLLLEARPHYAGHLSGVSAYFPAEMLDGHGQQVDLRPTHTWRLRLDEVSTVEMLEVQLVNVVAPFLLNSRLKPLLQRSSFTRRFIVNVSAMEGQFARQNKTVFHPHTNMAKAALNMMTRTSAEDYARDGIFMSSVDTGWVTDENPAPRKATLQEEQGFFAPLDVIDGMARIYDPIVRGIACPETPLYGHFLKDYAPYPW